TLTVSGNLAVASVTPAGTPATVRYSALKMGSVTVSGSTATAADFGLTGSVSLTKLDYNNAAAGVSRLKWAKAFDLDGDGQFDDALNPGAAIGSSLAIDLGAGLQLAVTGSATGSVVAGPVSVTLGTTPFALTRELIDVDSDGDGAADLLGAQVDGFALTLTNATVTVTSVATLTVSGNLAVASVTPAGTPATVRYTALKMGSVTVSGSTATAADFGLTGSVSLSKLDYNNAAAGVSRLNWAKAFDLDGDGQFDDALNPGAAIGSSLAIDLGAGLQLAVTGSATGSVVAGPVSVTLSTTPFALTRQLIDVDSDGDGAADLLGAQVDGFALTLTNATVTVTSVATLTVSGNLAVASVTPAGTPATVRYTAL